MKKIIETDLHVIIRFSNREQRFLKFILVMFKEFSGSYVCRQERAFATTLLKYITKSK